MPRYRKWACPECFRVETTPWDECFCPHDPVYQVQAHDPSDGEMKWTPMVELHDRAIREAIHHARLHQLVVEMFDEMVADGKLRRVGNMYERVPEEER